jgi:hypothetical protein
MRLLITGMASLAWAEEGWKSWEYFFSHLDVRKKKGRGEEALFDFKFERSAF